MAHDTAERKITYQGAGGLPLPDLDALPGVDRTRHGPAEDLTAVYYDTEDLALLSAGHTLGRRDGGDGAGWQLRTRGAAGPRVHTVPPDDGSGKVPAELRLRTAALVRGRALVPVARLHTRRERRHLLDAAGRVLARVAHDTVSAQALGGTHPATGTTLAARQEIGVELRRGKGTLLKKTGERLSAAGLSEVTAPGDPGRAMAAAGLTPPPAPRQKATGAGRVVLARLRDLADALPALDAAVRTGEPGAVHALRTTVRRLRSVLRTFRRIFQPARTRHLERELAHLGRVLGDARDHEVLAARFTAEARALRREGRTGPAVLKAVRAVAGRENAACRQAWELTRAELDRPRYYRLLGELDAFLAAPPFGPRARHDARRELRKAVRRTQRTLARRGDRALRTPPGPERDRALHDVRKAARRLRYAAETARPVDARTARRLARRARGVQRVLGEHQDAVVAAGTLPQRAAADHAAGRETFAHGLLYARGRAAAAHSEQEGAARYRRATRKKLTRF